MPYPPTRICSSLRDMCVLVPGCSFFFGRGMGWRTNREVFCQGGSKTTVSSPSASAGARFLGQHATSRRLAMAWDENLQAMRHADRRHLSWPGTRTCLTRGALFLFMCSSEGALPSKGEGESAHCSLFPNLARCTLHACSILPSLLHWFSITRFSFCDDVLYAVYIVMIPHVVVYYCVSKKWLCFILNRMSRTRARLF